MIRFLNDKTIGGDRFWAGSIAQFEVVDESELIATGDAAIVPVTVIIGQRNVEIQRSSNNSTDTVEQTLRSITIPGGTMGLNSKISIVCRWKIPGSINSKYMLLYFGGTLISAIVLNTASIVAGKFLVEVENINSLSTQAIFNGSSYAVSNSADITTAIDTSVDQAIDIRCRWSANVASETIILRSYSVIHTPGVA
jgi:hypothetical protein